MFGEKGIHMDFKLPPQPFLIRWDRYLLDRLVQNLMSNAAKYTPERGRIRLRFESNGNGPVICLFNSGAPIPPDRTEFIFERYKRSDKSGSKYSKGLGLFFCRMVARAHGSKIWVEPVAEGNVFKLGDLND
jgi:signal transduction histidine kinase